MDTSTIWDVAYNTGYAAHTFEGASVKYKHHVHDLNTTDKYVENDDPSPSSVSTSMPSGVYYDKGRYWSNTPGGCFTDQYYYCRVWQYWPTYGTTYLGNDCNWSGGASDNYYKTMPTVTQNWCYDSDGHGVYCAYNADVRLLKTVYTYNCGHENGEVSGVSVDFD